MKNKNSVFRLILRLLGTHIAISIFYFIAVYKLMVISENNVWQWIVTIISSLMFYFVFWIQCSAVGNDDANADAIAEKRFERSEESLPVKVFRPYKAVLSSTIIMAVPFILCIVLSITNNNIIDAILRVIFIPYIKLMFENWGVSVLAITIYAIIYVGVCLGGYMYGKVQRQKILDTIKRNDAKNKIMK